MVKRQYGFSAAQHLRPPAITDERNALQLSTMLPAGYTVFQQSPRTHQTIAHATDKGSTPTQRPRLSGLGTSQNLPPPIFLHSSTGLPSSDISRRISPPLPSSHSPDQTGGESQSVPRKLCRLFSLSSRKLVRGFAWAERECEGSELDGTLLKLGSKSSACLSGLPLPIAPFH